MTDEFKERAIKKAQKSCSNFKISAIALNKSGRIIAQACNKPRFSRYGGGKHAEMEVLRIGGNRIRTIIICRVGRAGDLRPIDPCVRCKKVLDKKGIKVITINSL